VLHCPGGFLPVEVKLGDWPSARDARYIEVFLDEFGSWHGLVV
jgi:hypothetical protein